MATVIWFIQQLFDSFHQATQVGAVIFIHMNLPMCFQAVYRRCTLLNKKVLIFTDF